MTLISSDGTPITVRPIEPGELDRIPLRCWPTDRAILDRLFAKQGTIGMAAWEGDKCVAELHCYRVVSPDGRNEDWPEWTEWWSPHWRPAAREADLELMGPVWCHACFHVGRTLESDREETRALVFRFARKNDWDCTRTLEALNRLDAVNLTRDTVESAIEELRSSGRTTFNTIEQQYHGRGIGTALCKESVRWVREHDYVAVLAPGAPDGLFEYAVWAGHLPWTTYAKLGFKVVNPPKEGDGLPGWAHDCPPKVMAEVQAALAARRPEHEVNERWMVLDLRPEVGPASR